MPATATTPAPTRRSIATPTSTTNVENTIEETIAADNTINIAIAQTATNLSDNVVSVTPANQLQQRDIAIASRDGIQRLLDEGDLQQAVEIGDRLLSEEFAVYLDQTLPQQPLSLERIQHKLAEMNANTGSNAALLYLFSGPKQLDLIVVSATGEIVYKSVPEADRETLMAEIKRLQEKIANPIRRQSTRYLPAAQQLYQWLIAPIEADLEARNIDTLMLSLDSGLRSLPIASLYDGEKFLAEKYQFSLVPSLSLTNTGHRNIQETSVLAMGVSEFTDQSPLPAVPVEVNAIAEKLWQGQAFLNQDLTLENLNKQRSQDNYGIIHLATHGQFEPGAIANSYIQLWDNKLRLNKMGELDWKNPPVQLLVLSACRTALGDPSAEFGFAGLAVQSGAQSAIASLWYSSDIGTLGLMAEFYHHLKTEPTKAAALRRAQTAFIRGEVQLKDGQLIGNFGAIDLPPDLDRDVQLHLKHPYYWSGFTTIGSP